MPHRRKPTPTRRLILELRTIAADYRIAAARSVAASQADKIPPTKGEALASRMGDIAKSARALLREFGSETDTDKLHAMAKQAQAIAGALDTAPGTAWQTQTYKPAAHAD
jgi:hypothetical protein